MYLQNLNRHPLFQVFQLKFHLSILMTRTLQEPIHFSVTTHLRNAQSPYPCFSIIKNLERFTQLEEGFSLKNKKICAATVSYLSASAYSWIRIFSRSSKYKIMRAEQRTQSQLKAYFDQSTNSFYSDS